MRLFSPRTPIGLDIGGHDVKAVQAARIGDGWKVSACARFGRANPAAPLSSEEVADVMAVLHRQGFVGKAVTIAASEKLISGTLELPARRPDLPLEQIARAEFARIHKCDMSTAEFSWWELPTPARAAKATHVMAVALSHADAEQQLKLFDSAGASVSAVDTVASALARTCLRSCGSTRAWAALDIGWRGATLILVRDGVLGYERRITSGGLEKLHAALAARLGVDAGAVEQVVQHVGIAGAPPDEFADMVASARPLIANHLDQIIQEVRKTCGYAQHQNPDSPVELLFLAGGGASIAGIVDHFRANIGIEVRPAQPASEGDASAGRQRMTSSHATAAGLSMFVN